MRNPNHRLAVLTPRWGMGSETFVKRHLTEISPGQTHGLVRDVLNQDWCQDVPRYELFSQPEGIWGKLLRGGGWSVESARTRSLREYLDRHGIDVVMGEWLNFSAKWFRSIHTPGRRFVAHAHGYDITARALASWSNRWLYRRLHEMDAVVTVSELGRQRLIRKIGLDASRIHVIPCGVEIPSMPSMQKHDDLIRVLCVGRMVPKKGQKIVLQAFGRIARSHPSVCMEFVGDGPDLAGCQEWVASHNLADRVVFHGARDQAFVFERMAAADVFVLHSVTAEDGDEEGLPVALLEAMARALPVLSTLHAGIPEAVTDGEHGYLVRERDVDALTERLEQLVMHESLRKRMGVAARQRVIDSFSAASEVERLRTLLFDA